jgi:hypothetical protein
MVDAAAELLPIAAVDNNMSSPRAEDEDEYEASPDSGMDEQPTRFPGHNGEHLRVSNDAPLSSARLSLCPSDGHVLAGAEYRRWCRTAG